MENYTGEPGYFSLGNEENKKEDLSKEADLDFKDKAKLLALKALIKGAETVEPVLEKVGQGYEKLASYSTTPLKAGLSKAIDVADEYASKPMEEQLSHEAAKKLYTAGLEGAKEGFGKSSDEVPTFKEIANRLGVSDKPLSYYMNKDITYPKEFQGDPSSRNLYGLAEKITPAETVGLGLDLAVDPLVDAAISGTSLIKNYPKLKELIKRK